MCARQKDLGDDFAAADVVLINDSSLKLSWRVMGEMDFVTFSIWAKIAELDGIFPIVKMGEKKN